MRSPRKHELYGQDMIGWQPVPLGQRAHTVWSGSLETSPRFYIQEAIE